MNEFEQNTVPSPQSDVPQPANPATGATKAVGGWSWGAFMFDMVFVIAIRKYIYLLFALLFFIPILGFFAMIGVKIFFGLKGHQLAAESGAFANEDELRGFLKAVDHAGFVVFIVAIVGIVLILGTVLLFGAALYSGMNPYSY
jgi:hypothetical protein